MTQARTVPPAGEPDAPTSLDGLKALVAQRFNELPARLQSAARYLIDHPNAAAVDTIKTLSGAAGLQPSVLVRLAQTLGYSGFSEMQRVFRHALLSQTQSYGERVRAQRGEQAEEGATGSAAHTLQALCDASIGSLNDLRDAIDDQALADAVALLTRARTVQVIGLRRAWPIATYLTYLLSRSQRYARLLGASGGMLVDEIRTLQSSDVLVAISFHPFHADTLAAAEQAQAQGVPVLTITDSRLSAFAHTADVVLEVRDAESAGFRTVAASMVLCHGLAMGVAMADPMVAGVNGSLF